jgi:hypothetical protein
MKGFNYLSTIQPSRSISSPTLVLSSTRRDPFPEFFACCLSRNHRKLTLIDVPEKVAFAVATAVQNVVSGVVKAGWDEGENVYTVEISGGGFSE